MSSLSSRRQPRSRKKKTGQVWVRTLYAHPDDHVRWLGALGAAGERNQLVVATTSERLLATVPARQIVRLPVVGG